MAHGLKEFVKQYTKKGSISVNQAGVISFLAFIYGKQRGAKDGSTKKDQLQKYDDLSIQYIEDETRDRLKDATAFAASLARSGSPPMTAKSRLNAVHGFLAFNDIDFTEKKWLQAFGKLPKGHARTQEIEIDVLTVRKVLEHADIKTKSLVCFLVSTGCRLNEALGIHIENIAFDGDNIAKVSIPGELTKNGDPRVCYCSTEAVRYLKEWMKIRPAYMKSAEHKANGLGNTRPEANTDNRLFPYSDGVAIKSWNNFAEKAGFGATDRSTRRKTLHLHMMRKLYRSQLALKCPTDIVEGLMGHAAYLSDAYRRLPAKQIRESYEKGSSVLHIFGDADLDEVRVQLDTTAKDLQETKTGQEKTATALSSVVLENKELKTQLETMRTEIGEIKQQQAKLASQLLNEINRRYKADQIKKK